MKLLQSMTHFQEFKMCSCIWALVLIHLTIFLLGIWIVSFIKQMNAFIVQDILIASIELVDLSQILTVVTIHFFLFLLISLKRNTFIKLHMLIWVFTTFGTVIEVILQKVLLLVIWQIVQVNVLVLLIAILIVTLVNLHAIVV